MVMSQLNFNFQHDKQMTSLDSKACDFGGYLWFGQCSPNIKHTHKMLPTSLKDNKSHFATS
jgi:hypothetical protein